MASTESMIPFFENADYFTATATTDVTGKQLVKLSGGKAADGTYQVAVCGAADANLAIGIAAFKAKAGQRVTVGSLDHLDSIVPLIANGAVAPGDHLTTAAAGAVTTTTTAGTKCVAIAMHGAANGADIEAMLARHTI